MPIINKPKPTATTPSADPAARKGKRRLPNIRFDLNNPADRGKFALSGLVLLVVLILIGAAGIGGYTYMESPEFCGTLCHSMGPQFTQHNVSAHVNVECVACHIGPGVEHFVRSKINGARQLLLTLNHSYNMPIKGPVKDLRPARETCENCHNPQSFKDNIIKSIVHFDNDQANTKLQTTLVLKMGGKQADTSFSQGIHWHITSKIFYISTDEQRKTVDWIGVQQADGTMKEYFSPKLLNVDRKAYVEASRTQELEREMDCIDCHNRTAHYIATPEQVVDKSLALNLLSPTMPFIRSKVVDFLRQQYPTHEQANTAISALVGYYKQNYPDTVAGKTEAMATELKSVYDQTSFPDMKAFWDTNPNFERHAGASGCFRCHDGQHVSEDSTGKVVGTISSQCNACHSVPITSRGTEIGVNTPIIGGTKPATHNEFRWTIEHSSTTEMQKVECYQCHGEKSCNNSVCHGVSHPPDMLYSHPTQFQNSGPQACYMCHQDVLCSKCHTSIATNGYTSVMTSTTGTTKPFTTTNGSLNVLPNPAAATATSTSPRK